MLLAKIIAMLGAFVLFGAIGFGPTVLLTSSRYRRRLLVSAALSPAIGAIVVAFSLYTLFLLDIPIRLSALPVTLAALVFSAVLIVFDWRARSTDYRNALQGVSPSKWLATIGIVGAILITLLLPPIFGEEAFQYYQTNTYDATNYVLMATFSVDFPAGYVGNTARYTEIVQHNPSLSIVMPVIASWRPSASHLLAWQSVLFNQSPLTLYHFSKLLSLLIVACIAAALGYQLGLRRWQQLSLMLVSSTGFWALYVSDVDALSQIYAIPLSLLLIFAFIQFERENRLLLFSRHRCFLALGLAALFCFYPEIALPFMAVLACYYTLGFSLKPSRAELKVIGLHSVTFGLSGLLLNVMLPSLISFAGKQSNFALAEAETSTQWANAFFHWLFYDHDPFISGLWGLYYFRPSPIFNMGEVLKAAFIILMFIMMAAVVGKGILKSLTTPVVQPENRLLALLVVVYWGGGLLLYLIGNDWVAGKSIAMGAPFMVLAVFVFFKDYFSHPNLLNQLLQIGLVVWIGSQALILPLRTLAITNGLVLPNVVNLSQAAFPDVILPITDSLRQEKPTLIGFDVADPKPPIVFSFALSLRDVAPVWFSDGIPLYYDAVPLPERWMTTASAPSHLVLSDKRDYLKPLGLGRNLHTVPAHSLVTMLDYVTVYAVNPGDYDTALYRADILNPEVPSAPAIRGMDAVFLPDNEDHFARWMTNDSSEVHFVSSDSHPLGVIMEFDAAYSGKMNLDLNDNRISQFPMSNTMRTQSNRICVTTQAGSNVLKFTHEGANSDAVNRVLIRKLLFAPVDTLDVGAVGDARQIGAGWQAQENWGEESVRWAEQTAQFQMITCHDLVEMLTLHFRAFVPPEVKGQGISVQVNGNVVGIVRMENGWAEYTVDVPNEILLQSGLQSIQLDHTNKFIPTNDTRVLAAAYDRFWFTPPSAPR